LKGSESWTHITLGWTGAVQMLITLLCISIAWWTLQHVKLDLFIRNPQSLQSKMIHLILAILVGRAVAKFFIDYWGWTQALRFLF